MKKNYIIISFLFVMVAVSAFFLIGCSEDKPVTVSRFLMDTKVDLTLYGVSQGEAEDLADEVFAEMERLEKMLSLHEEGSEVDLINESAGFEAVKVSDETYYVIESFLEMARLTEGAFDATIAPVLHLWGFGQGEQTVPDEEELQEALALVDYNDVILDDNNKVKLARKGMKLDLGGIAKGFIVDQGISVLEEKQVEAAFLNAGGDISILGAKPDNTLWRVGVQDPASGSGVLAVINLEAGAVASSGNYERFFEEEGVYYHHILDPQTGYPTEGIAGVTIVADDCTAADIVSTVIFVMGVQDGLSFLEDAPNLEGVIIDEDDNIYYTSGLENQIEL